MARTARALLVVLTAGLLLAGCTQVVVGQPNAAAGASRLAVAPVADADVAQTAVAALQEYWRTQFPAAFGRPWRDITRFLPVHTRDRRVPCVQSTADVSGQAFYCPAADAVVWDADGLIPEVLRTDGPTGVLVVLAHEVGHAVQTRLGLDALQARQPSRYPTILLEAMADCSAGVALAHFAQKPPPGLAPGTDERDRAISALIAFKDPLGVEPGDAGAHGNAFDRVSAFQDGYGGTAATCAQMTITNRTFTQRAFGSRADAARRGNLPVDELLAGVGADAPAAFARFAASAGLPGWRPPALSTTAGRCAVAEQGPVAWCPEDNTVVVDRAAVAQLEDRFGDFAGAALIAGRYGLAAQQALGRAATGAAAICLAGAYTGGLLKDDGSFTLSPGDLDEAVEVLLVQDWAGRDAAGATDPQQHGYERIGLFRTGVVGGPQACPA
jgi:predicted metalloprotease